MLPWKRCQMFHKRAVTVTVNFLRELRRVNGNIKTIESTSKQACQISFDS